MEEFGGVCRRKKLKVKKSKVMLYARDCIFGEMNFMMDGQVLEEAEVFKYLGSLVIAVGGIAAEVQQSVLDWSKVLGAVRNVLKDRTRSCICKENIVLECHSPNGHLWC